MDNLAAENYIITAFAALLIITVSLSAAKKIAAGRKFKDSKKLIRLYAPCGFFMLFTLITAALTVAVWYFVGDTVSAAALTAALFSGAFYMAVFQFSASGVTKEALFISGKKIEWHNVCDHYMDKQSKKVIFSDNAKGGLTLKGVSMALRYKKEDEEALEKFLDSHRNKFIKRLIIR